MTATDLSADFIDALRQSKLLPLPSARPGGLTLADAYALAMALERRRMADGDTPVGWKIGFTNRRIWPRYGVHQPIWGRVWRSTLTLLDEPTATVSLGGLVQPRIEPEIVFRFASAPQADMTMDELIGCLDWVAHGVEIVHTHFEAWRFGDVADTVADFGLHGRLIVGPRRPASEWPAMSRDLAALSMQLLRGDEIVDRGQGALVLDGPVHALRHWLQAMRATSPGWTVAAGEVVTTGTLTDAWPVAAGERWQTRPADARLAALDLSFTA